MLTFSSVSVAFDARPVLRDVTLSVAPGSRTAVVGVNGSGKSTLLRVAAGEVRPDTGTVTRAPGVSVALVPQDYGLVAGALVADYLKDRAGVLASERRLRSLEQAMASGAERERAVAAYGVELDRFAALGGWEHAGRAERALGRLGLGPDLLRRRVGELSGGEQVRVGLAAVLASRRSLYLLDEPTNNLDLAALEVLEEFVATADAAFLLVSHDRAFLDATATDVVEIDEHDHTASRWGVGFAEYRALRERALAARSARYRAYVEEVARLRAAAARQRQRASRTGDRRPRRDNDKFAPHFFAQRSSEQAGKVARELERRLDRLDAVEDPRTGWELRLTLESADRSGDLVLAAEGVEKRLGDFSLGPVSLEVRWRDRVALLGHNGAGKSLLLAVLTGVHEPDAGAVRAGSGVRFGVLRQGGADLAGAATGLAAFRAALGWPEARSRTLLAKFDLGAGHVLRPVASYSPGERCRLGLAILMARGANCLVLDEPTNHLDLEAAEELEQALAGFDGTLLVVSHDREFLDRVAVTRTLELTDGRIRDRAGVAAGEG